MNTSGLFSNLGTLFASTLDNTGGEIETTGTIDAATSVSNAGTILAQGIITTPTLTNTGIFSLTGDLAGPIATFTNNSAGTVTVGVHALTGVGALTNNSVTTGTNPAVFVDAGGSIGTSASRTVVTNNAGQFGNRGTIFASTLTNSGGEYDTAGTIDASASITNASTMVAQGVITTPTLINTGSFSLSGDLAGPIGAFTNNGTGTVNVGTHALTGVGTLTNNSTASGSNPAVFVDVGGSIGTSGSRTAIVNASGRFSSLGTLFASTILNSGGEFDTAGTIDASASVTNASTMVAQGTIAVPSLVNTGSFSLSGDLAGPIAAFTNDGTGTVDIGAHALTGVAAFTNNSTTAGTSAAVFVDAGGSIGSTAARTAVVNTAGQFYNAGALFASTLNNTGGTVTTFGTIDASSSVVNASTMIAQGTITTPTLINTGSFALSGDLAGPIATFTNNGSGTIDIGAHALTGVGTFINNGTSALPNGLAVSIAASGSLGTSAAPTAIVNTNGTFQNWGTINASTLDNTGGTFIAAATTNAATAITNAGTMLAQGTITTPSLTNTGTFSLFGTLSGAIASFHNTGSGTVDVGSNALTGVAAFTNDSVSVAAVNVDAGGSIGIVSAPTMIANNSGTFTTAGTLYATSVTNAGTMNAQGTIVAPTIANTGAFNLYGALSGAVTSFTNNGAGTVNIGANALNGVGTFTNNSNAVNAVQVAAGGSIGTLDATTDIVNTAGTFSNAGTLNASLVSITGGTLRSLGVLNAATSVTNAGTLDVQGIINTPTISNSGTFLLAGSMGSQTALDNSGTFDISGTANGASLGTVSGSGTIALGAQTLTLTAAHDTFDGTITGTGGLALTGGTETLTGVNSYSGGTSISNATLNVASDAAMGDPSGALSLNNGVVTALQSFSSGRAVTLTGTGTINTNASQVALSGSIGGSGVLVAAGGGTLTLSGTNTYTGGTNIIEHTTLVAGSDQALGASTAPLTITSGVLSASASFSSARTISILQDGSIASNGYTLGLTGPIYVDGTLTQALSGTSQIAGGWTLSGTNGLIVDGTLHGVGTVTGATTILGSLSPGNSPGTLTFTASVVMGDNSDTHINVDGTGTGTGHGNYSRAIVTGAGNTFTAAGTLTPILRGITGDASNTYTPVVGQKFVPIQAEGGVLGSYVALIEPTSGMPAGAEFETVYTPNAISLYVAPISYTNLGAFNINLTKNQVSAGTGLDALRPVPGVRNSAAVASVLDTLFQQAVGNLPALQDHVSGTVYGDALIANLKNTAMFNSIIGERNAMRRGDVSGVDPIGTKTVDGVTTWALVQSQGLQSSAVAGVGTGFKASTWGMTAGLERTFAEFTIGAAGSYGSGSINSAATNGRASTDLTQSGLYASWNRNGYFVNAQAGGNYLMTKATRSLSEFGLTATGSGGGFGGSGAVEAGARQDFGTFYIEPTVGARYDSVSRDKIAESHAGVLSLNVNQASVHDISGLAGIRIQSAYAIGGGMTIVPSSQLQIAHQLNSTCVLTNTAFQGASGVAMQSNSVKLGDTSLLPNIGVELRTSNFSVYAVYQGELQKQGASQTFNAGVKAHW